VAVGEVDFVTHQLCDDLAGVVQCFVPSVVEAGRRTAGWTKVIEQLGQAMVDAGRKLFLPVTDLLLDADRGCEEFRRLMANGTRVTARRRGRGRTTISTMNRLPPVRVGRRRQRREVGRVGSGILVAMGTRSVLLPRPTEAMQRCQESRIRGIELEIHESRNACVG
jgi:hypothetical protein